MDYNATTPLDREVLATIHRSLKFAWGNPSSSHQAGKMLKVELTTFDGRFILKILVYLIVLLLVQNVQGDKHIIYCL